MNQANQRHTGPYPTSRSYPYLAALAASLMLAACGDNSRPGVDLPDASMFPDGDTSEQIARPADPIPGQYIFFLDDAEVPRAAVRAVAEELVAPYGGAVLWVMDGSLRAFMAGNLDDAPALDILADPRVVTVGQDGYLELDEAVGALATEQRNPTWGLDRIDQAQLPLDSLYQQKTTGAGVNVYVMDSGINPNHAEFAGRMGPGMTVIDDGLGTADCNGHGTHVAGTIGGTAWGVAKDVTLHPVRVFGCNGSTSYSKILGAIDWVTTNHIKPAVVNMSLGGPAYDPLDTAVRRSIEAGVIYAVAAGNSNADACNFSPARTAEALTVGASNADDQRAWFSNFGACVDIFAPGTAITSARHDDNAGSVEKQGTSMAAPHVAGVVALYLEANPDATQAAVNDAMIGAATTGAVQDLQGSPDRLLYAGFVQLPPPTCELGGFEHFDENTSVSEFGNGTGWESDPSSYETIRLADVNGDGRQDVCGRGSDGMWCALGAADGGFEAASAWTGAGFSNAEGWNMSPSYWKTFRYPDVTGDGMADICARGIGHLVCARSTGSSFTDLASWSTAFSNANGWSTSASYYETIQYADLDGDGKDDVCGRYEDGVYCALSTGTGFGSASVWTTNFSDVAGWGLEAHWRTVRLVDVSGDGKADICGRAGAGILCELSTGSGFGPESNWSTEFSNGNGWDADPSYYRTIQYADIDGDGMIDVCGRAADGMHCAVSTGTEFAPATLWTSDFSDAQDWGTAEYYWRTIRLADVNGDGKADVCGRGNGVMCAVSTGSGFETRASWADFFRDDQSWTDASQWTTIRFGDVNGDGAADVCGRGSSGMLCGMAARGSGTCGLPSTCADIRSRDPAAGDGEYTLYIDGSSSMPWTAYCHDMAGTPAEYLTLVSTGANRNFSQYTAGGFSPGTSVRTNYTRVRVDPADMTVLIADQTFSSSTGSLSHGSNSVTSMPYGVAMSCDSSASGVANLDLTGTPFAVESGFCQGGFEPLGVATPSMSAQVFDLTGGGSCGWTAPNLPSCPGDPFNASPTTTVIQLTYVATPATCADVAALDPAAGDGEYTLYIDGDASKPWTAYCHDMAGEPREYLTLPSTGANRNFAQYTAGGAASGTSVRTSYTRVRIDPLTLSLIIVDQTFSSSTGSLKHGGQPVTSMPYGVAMSCDARASGVANIDLTGTPFAVAGDFCQAGWRPQGTATPSMSDQVVDITGGGYCGWSAPNASCPYNPFNTTPRDTTLPLTYLAQ